MKRHQRIRKSSINPESHINRTLSIQHPSPSTKHQISDDSILSLSLSLSLSLFAHNLSSSCPSYLSLSLTHIHRHNTGRHHPTRRQRVEKPPIPARPRRRHRPIPAKGDAADVKGARGEAEQGEAVHQDGQLQPPDADTVHA